MTFSEEPRHQIAEIVRAIRIVDDATIAVRGRRFLRREVAMPRSSDVDQRPLNAVVAQLAYSELYTRLRPRAVKVRDRGLLATLSRANSGTGTWEPGWTLRAQADDYLVVERDGLHVMALGNEVRFVGNGDCKKLEAPARVGAPCRLRIPKEQFCAVPGYYVVIGDSDARDSEGRIVRVYANLRADGAAMLVEAATRHFNSSGIPFRMKLLIDSNSYVRADAAVIYLDQTDYAQSVPALREIARAVAEHVIDEAPLLCRRVARGFAVAEDPGNGQSFGMHRCSVIASAIVRSRRRRAPLVLRAVHEALDQVAVDVNRPYLNRGSDDIYATW